MQREKGILFFKVWLYVKCHGGCDVERPRELEDIRQGSSESEKKQIWQKNYGGRAMGRDLV